MNKELVPKVKRELGYVYCKSDQQCQINKLCEFACWDKITNSFWLSYPKQNIIENISYDKKVISTIYKKATWVHITSRHTLLLSVTDENLIEEITVKGDTIQSWTCNAPVSVVEFHDGCRMLIAETNPNALVIINKKGERIWTYSPGSYIFRTPGNACLWRDGFLAADRYNHCISFIKFDCTSVCVFGIRKVPNNTKNTLCAPHCVWPINDNNLLVCDSLNGRVVQINREKKIIWQYGDENFYGSKKNLLWMPRVAQPMSDSEVLICDSMNNRVIVVDKADNRILWEYGEPIVEFVTLKLPRSIIKSGNHLLIADTHHHNVVEMDYTGQIIWQYGDYRSGDRIDQLFFPRCICEYKEGYIIADAGNHRLTILDHNRRFVKTIEKLNGCGNWVGLSDPHDIKKVNERTFLLTDSGLDAIIMFDIDGSIIWMYKEDLNDPHFATISKGIIAVADCGNNRIVELNMYGKFLRCYSEICGIQFITPRFIQRYGQKEVIVDLMSDKRRVIVYDCEKKSSVYFSYINKPISMLKQTRWLTMDSDSMIISDTGNSRILLMERMF